MGALLLFSAETYPDFRQRQACGYDFTILANEKMILLFCRNEKTIFTERGGTGETVGNVNETTIIKYIAEQYERDRLTGDSVK